ncbi:hypothetical protein RAC89_01045 [Paenibacillus sp. GD4]|jgi:hypothetical protein|uniref:hypothetical protein n=1 Tax=Paenibacillus TaxID=44249 RepID=UPI00254274B3|nr:MULTISPECIES: hypothetical protein [Paenibacillus]MDQ1909083.1 hypothetical protein [Paenibacillus sp. GD4]
MSFSRLVTDRQFEMAFLTHSSVYARHRKHEEYHFIGGLDGFNPLLVTVSGTKLERDEYDFLITK